MAECGTRASYLAHCRCPACKQANAAYMKAHRQRTLFGQVAATSATDTRRRSLDDWDTWTAEQLNDLRTG